MSPFLQRVLYLLVLALLGTGLLDLWSDWQLAQDVTRLPPDWTASNRMLHGIAAYALMFVAGIVAVLHVAPRWRLSRQRKSGLMLAALLVALAVSGLALYYAGSERLRNVSDAVHWLAGLALPLLLAVHVALVARRDG